MSTLITAKPTASADDALWVSVGVFGYVGAYLAFGKFTNTYTSCIRFRAVDVPKDATIESAKITFISDDNYSGSYLLKIKAESNSHPASWSDITDFGSRSWTSGIDWDGSTAWTLNSSYDSIDISSIIQTVVNYADWVSGHDIAIAIEDDGSGSSTAREGYTWDGDSDKCAVLSVTYADSVVAPTVTTTAITDILGTSATSGGTVTNTGGEAVTDQGVCWSTSTNPTVADSHTHDVADPSPFVSSLTSLTANTIYHVKAFATNSAGTSYGAEVDFETDVVPTLAATTAISKITHATASSGGNVTADGGATITARGVCWNTSTNPTTANSKTTDAGTTGAYTSAITGLTAATTYHLKPYATNSVGTTYGTEVDFTTDTLSDISDAVFTVTEAVTPIVTSLSDSTVYAGQVITITGTDFGAVEGYVRFIWNYAAITSWAATSIVVTVPPSVVAGNLFVGLPTEVWSAGTAYTLAVVPTLTTAAISAIAATTATGGGEITSDGNATVTAHGICWNTATAPTTANSKTDDILDPTPFVSSITGLTRSTKYYVRSYATNPVGTGYGPEVEFTSLALAPTLTTSDVTQIAPTTATGGGTLSDTGGSAITQKGACWALTANPTTSSSMYEEGPGGIVGSVWASTMDGLAPLTLYHVRAYATNAIGTSYGADTEFTTQSAMGAIGGSLSMGISIGI
jgi:hypothetical protein